MTTPATDAELAQAYSQGYADGCKASQLTKGDTMNDRVIAFVANTIHADGPHGEPPLLAIAYNEPGYHPIYTRLTADDMNKGRGISAEVAQAFLVGSMFGWRVPGAKPARDWHFATFGKVQS